MTVRIGFAGAGFIARFHLDMLAGAAIDHEVVAVLEPDDARARAFADRTGARRVTVLDELMAACDAVYICTWTSAHGDAVRAAARAGRAVFCEKPLGRDLTEAMHLARVVDAASVPNQVGLVLRGSPAFRWVRHLLEDPTGGRLCGVSFRDDQCLPVGGIYDSAWRTDRTLAGSGVLMEHSIHDLDLLDWLAGPITSVIGQTASLGGHAGIEDVAGATLALRDGAIASMMTLWHDLVERQSQRRIEIFCERLHIVVDGDWFGPVHWTRAGARTETLEGAALFAALPSEDQGAMNPDESFLRALVDGTVPAPSFADAVRAHRLVDAIYRSAASGTACDPDDPVL